jgi:hypothetical protein
MRNGVVIGVAVCCGLAIGSDAKVEAGDDPDECWSVWWRSKNRAGLVKQGHQSARLLARNSKRSPTPTPTAHGGGQGGGGDGGSQPDPMCSATGSRNTPGRSYPAKARTEKPKRGRSDRVEADEAEEGYDEGPVDEDDEDEEQTRPADRPPVRRTRR